MAPTGTVTGLCVYPIRGMSAQHLEQVRLSPERGFPHDRAWALARHGGEAIRLPEKPLSSYNYHGPTYDPRLAGIRTQLNTETQQLEVYVREHQVLSCCLAHEGDRAEAEQLLARVLDLDPHHAPRLIRRTSENYNYTYTATISARMGRAVHIVNLASVRELGERVGEEIDPLRFRANIYFDAGEAWVERNWTQQRLGLGEAGLTVEMGTPRCAATEVNRATAELDIPVPRLLKQHYGHTEMGLYATVEAAGTVTLGAPIHMLGADAGDGR
ncbi:MOSC domain-containing protein [Nesterenkonia muleiensis]|uniref:MOSC domain-containing protein n=1 Tax=Nesterenkonia muleiensis TaxID=2282648 RepID=UPI000E7569AE|nr:MOSC domain-containing protein [Nesterenkonia muleiensis]